jgi:ferrous iron transport protein B
MGNGITIGLVGNPNCGKTTVFNNLTGTRQHVGNWPGKTVEKKEGTVNHQGHRMTVVDLPGVYGLTAYSLDEVVARNFIVEEKPDVVVDIVDASNIERNLYLTVQLLEMEANVVVGLNMMDLAEERGYKIDVPKLSRLLGVPVVPLVANKNKGTVELLDAMVKAGTEERKTGRMVEYSHDVEDEIGKIEQIVRARSKLADRYPARWLSLKILEGDEEILKTVS